MGRRDSQLLIAIALLSATMLAGCGGSNPAGPIITGRQYGPPFEAIIFTDGEGFLATVKPVQSGDDPVYVHGVGSGLVGNVAYGFLLRPGSSPNSAHFAVYDRDVHMLYVLDNNGNESTTYFNGAVALENMFAFTGSGSRIAYVINGDAGEQLILDGVGADEHLEIATLDPNEHFYGRPTLGSEGSNILLGMMIEDPNGDTRISIYNRTGSILHTLTTPVQALAYSPNSSKLAYVDASNQSELVILNSSLTELARVSFSSFSTGATALSWSPDDNNIAFFAGSATAVGKLLVYNLGTEQLNEIFYDETYVYPIGADKLWADPSWSSTGTELAFTARTAEGQYDVIKVAVADGFTTVLHEDVGGPQHVEWMEE